MNLYENLYDRKIECKRGKWVSVQLFRSVYTERISTHLMLVISVIHMFVFNKFFTHLILD